MSTLEELKTELSEFKASRTKALKAQEYSGLSGRMTVKRADLATISEEIKNLEMRIAIASNKNQLPCSTSVFSGER